MKVDKFIMQVVLVLFLGYIIYGFYSGRQLINNFRITSGKVTGCHLVAKSGGGIEIEYMYRVGSYESKQSDMRRDMSLASCYDHFLGKSFLVAYHPEDKELSFLLFSPEGYKKFNLTYPDSLLWVSDCLK